VLFRLKTKWESTTGRSRKVQLEMRGLLMKLCKARLIASLLPVILMMCAREATAQTYILDNFESASRRIVQPQSTVDNQKYLWGLYLGGGPVDIVTSDKHDGTRSLKATQSSGPDFQLQLYTYTEFLQGWDNGWKYARQFVNNPLMLPTGGTPAWPLNKLNRLRFWIKLPPGYTGAFPDHNFEFGTYIRDLVTDVSLAESSNQHYYHLLDLRSTGEWEQVIIDTHPDHQRGDSGGVEVADSPQTPVPGYNYFDMMTRFYIDAPYDAQLGDHFVDGFEFYQETNPENTAQIRSLHAVYIPKTNGIEVGWTRPATEDGINHEVRYAFSSIHALGWANATVPSNTLVTPQGSGGYNSMRWTSTAINVSGKSVVYIAIKPQNATLFREIAIPVGPGSTVSNPVPNPPTGVSVH
jgi:hypothetical protein